MGERLPRGIRIHNRREKAEAKKEGRKPALIGCPETLQPPTIARRVRDEAVLGPFTPDEQLFSLDEYFGFAPDDRFIVKTLLQMCASYLPTAEELAAAHKLGNSAEVLRTERYRDIITAGVRFMGNTLSFNLEARRSEIAKYRDTIYGMVKGLTTDQLNEGLQRINLAEAGATRF